MTNQSTAAAIAYRPMNEDDLPAAHALSQAVRWPHRLEDWRFAHRLAIGFVAEHDGAVIGTALCWRQGELHGSLGLIIVSPQHQGMGIGRKLMHLVLEALGERWALLHATAAGQPLYESLGFAATGAVHQHQGEMEAVAPVVPPGERLRPAGPDDLAKMIALANRATGMSRDAVLTQLVGVGEGAVLERDGDIVGFSLLRRFGRGQVIGPVVASDNDRARALIAYWSGAHAGAFVRVDVTGDCGLGAWLAEAGLAQVDPVVAMARNGAPPRDEAVRQFAIVNQALG